MAGLTAPSLQSLESERFRVLPLWNWSLAAAKVALAGDEYVGVGFDPSRELARLKARSEALERFVYGGWRNSGISPFSGTPCDAPHPAAGFSAHSDQAEAAGRAFHEWRERAALAAVETRKLALRPSPVPEMGLLFQPGLAYIGCELEVFVSAGPPFVAFALGILDPAGVVFGSACRTTSEAAIKSAIAECLRKTAYLSAWRERAESTDRFFKAIHFWTSNEGFRAARVFLGHSAETTTDSIGLPLEMDAAFLQTLRLDDLWVCSYTDPRYPLPEVGGTSIPLV